MSVTDCNRGAAYLGECHTNVRMHHSLHGRHPRRREKGKGKPVACEAGARWGGKGERKAREARGDWRSLLPPALILTFLPPFLRPATQASKPVKCKKIGRGRITRVPSPSHAHFDFPPSLSMACHAGYMHQGQAHI